jgi:tRNA (guanine-N7-)-methyltransferase
MPLKKLFKKIYYKYILRFQPYTVVLRERISDEEENYLLNHKNYLQKLNLSNKKIILEIGFGNGGHIVNLAKKYVEQKEVVVFGTDLYKPGAVKVLKEVDRLGLANLLITCTDARDVIKQVSKNKLWKTFILFPDPWTKKRQFKKRLVNEEFLEKVLEKTVDGGEVVLATDWENYAESMEKILEELSSEKKIVFSKMDESEEVKNIFETTFAKRAKREGRSINIFKVIKL